MQLRLRPPPRAQQAAKRALAWRAKYGRGGLTPSEAAAQGIGSGITRARGLASGAPLEVEQIKRIAAYFQRHAVDRLAPGFDDLAEPSNGRIAWDLWGGDPMRDFVEGVLDTLPADLGGRA